MKPREWWMNEYADGSVGVVHLTKDGAKSTAPLRYWVKTIKVREVLPRPKKKPKK